MLKMQDVGELAYGGLVMGTQWMDSNRIQKGTLSAKSIWKKYSTWTYLGIGVIATLVSAFGWMRKYESWAENISHGFIFYLPIFAKDMITSMGTSTGRTASADAVAQAQRILAQSRTGALGAGKATERSYQEQFNSVGAV